MRYEGKPMTTKEAIERLEYIKEHQIDPEDYELFDFAIRALAERDDLVERAYGHIVGQGTKGVIRPDDLTKSEMES